MDIHWLDALILLNYAAVYVQKAKKQRKKKEDMDEMVDGETRPVTTLNSAGRAGGFLTLEHYFYQ